MEIVCNSFARIRFDRPARLDLLLENVSFEIVDYRVLQAMVLAGKPIAITELVQRLGRGSEEAAVGKLVDELLRAKVLVTGTYKHPLLEAAKHWQRRGWLDALILHLQSRDIPYMDFGTTTFIRHVSPAGPELLEHENGAERLGPVVRLSPSGVNAFKNDLLEVMDTRRSGLPWSGTPLDLQQLGDILFYSNAESRRNRAMTLESSDESASFDYSSYSALETFVVVNEVEGLDPGVYAYAVSDNHLVLVKAGQWKEDLVRMCIGQGRVRNCSAALIIAAQWAQYFTRYRHSRAYRNLLINTAELAHLYILSATAMGFSNFITPAFNDHVAEGLMGVRATERGPLYMVAIG